jgi:hypothetical protein
MMLGKRPSETPVPDSYSRQKVSPIQERRSSLDQNSNVICVNILSLINKLVKIDSDTCDIRQLKIELEQNLQKLAKTPKLVVSI